MTTEFTIGDSDPYFRGDSLRLDFPIVDNDSTSDLNLEEYQPQFVITEYQGGPTVIDGSDDGISVTLNESTKRAVVKIDPGTTTDLVGDFFAFLRIIDEGNDADTLAAGDITISDR